MKRIIQYEWRMLWRERTLWLVCGLLAVAAFYGLSSGAVWIGFQQRTIAEALAEQAERLNSMQAELRLIEQGQAQPKRFRDPARPGWVGEFLGPRYAVLPPAALAPLSIGQRDLYPYYFLVSTLSADTFINEDEIENPFNLLAGRFDLAFVIIYLFPLAILAFSFNLLSFEKENGTLTLALSQPLRLNRIVIGKAIARAAPVIALAISLSLAGAFWSGAKPTSGDLPARLSLWTLAVSVYGMFWFAVAVAVNAYGRSSAANAVALACAWLTLVIILPALITVYAQWRYAVPSRLAFINAVRDEQRATAAKGPELRERFYAEHPELRPAEPDRNDFMPGFYAAQFDRDKRLIPLAAHYEAQLGRQHALARKLQPLSPAVAMQAAMGDLAGGGFERYARFVEQVHAYHRQWQDFFLPKLFKRESLKADDYNRFPKFEYAEEAAGAVLGRATVSLLCLLALTLIAFVIAWRRLKSYSAAV